MALEILQHVKTPRHEIHQYFLFEKPTIHGVYALIIELSMMLRRCNTLEKNLISYEDYGVLYILFEIDCSWPSVQPLPLPFAIAWVIVVSWQRMTHRWYMAHCCYIGNSWGYRRWGPFMSGYKYPLFRPSPVHLVLVSPALYFPHHSFSNLILYTLPLNPVFPSSVATP